MTTLTTVLLLRWCWIRRSSVSILAYIELISGVIMLFLGIQGFVFGDSERFISDEEKMLKYENKRHRDFDQ